MRTVPSLGLCLLLVFAGCATQQPAVDCVALGPGASLCLLAPAALPAVDGAQLVDLDIKGERQTFIGQLHMDRDAIRLAGTSLMGPNLFVASYDGMRVQLRPADFPAHADLLIAMLELVSADADALRPNLRGLTLTESHDGDLRVRDLSHDGTVVVHMEVGDGPLPDAHIRFEIPAVHLSMVMRPLDAGTPP